MSPLSDFIQNQLYPALFDKIDLVFPEHNFKQGRNGWASNTYIDGSEHKKRKDKTVISTKVPGIILEQGGPHYSLIDYVIWRDNTDFIGALTSLCKAAGLAVPKSEYDAKNILHRFQRQSVLEEAQSYFVYCLENSKSKEAKALVDYLHNSRKYSPELIREMELGYMPSYEKTRAYLLETKKIDKEKVDAVFPEKNPDKRVGTAYSLTIPFRAGGALKGFKYRTIDPSKSPKYVNQKGMKLGEAFFGLPTVNPPKDLVLMEGELDCLSAQAAGMENAVAIGGLNIHDAQIKHAIKKGVQSITLCFDGDQAAQEKLEGAVSQIIRFEEIRLYVAMIEPKDGDPDQIIREKGIQALNQYVRSAANYYEFKQIRIIKAYEQKQKEKGGVLTRAEFDKMIEDVLRFSAQMRRPIDKERYLNLFLEQRFMQKFGLGAESLKYAAERLQFKKEKERRSESLNTMLKRAGELMRQGEDENALAWVMQQAPQIAVKAQSQKLQSLLETYDEQKLSQALSQSLDGLNIGFEIDGEPLLMPAGALSIFAAPTSHGKTSVLINAALNAARQNPKQEFHLFSYEESAETILLKALNVFLQKPVSANPLKSLKSCFKRQTDEFIGYEHKAFFYEQKKRFFEEFIRPGRLRIHYIDDSSDTLINALRYLKSKSPVGGVFVDYVQLLKKTEGGKRYYSRQEELKQICLDLKDAAVETGLPLVLGAQFNREVVNLCRMHATKIGEAGDIERVANVIVGIWNTNFTAFNASDLEKQEIIKRRAESPNGLYVELLKNRDGKAGIYDLWDITPGTQYIKTTNEQANKQKLTF